MCWTMMKSNSLNDVSFSFDGKRKDSICGFQTVKDLIAVAWKSGLKILR